ncbi:MAG: alpha-E domain-containing protein [Burkholderiaceae bacterium]
MLSLLLIICSGCRYTERAENTARILDVNYHLLLPQSSHEAQGGWEGLLRISELMPAYINKYGAEITPRNVIDFMSEDELNPSSIVACLRAARENARAVREPSPPSSGKRRIRPGWSFLACEGGSFRRDPSQFFEWVKFRSHLSRGVAIGTMLRDEAFHFYRMGTFLERADNTARLLDVKYHAAYQDHTSDAAAMEEDFDFYQWSAILRSVSGFEVYRKVYRDVITPAKVAELLVLRADMPRSMAACVNELVDRLNVVANDHSGETQRRAGKLKSELQFARIDEILAAGLHAFLTQFLDRINELGARISSDFLMPS